MKLVRLKRIFSHLFIIAEHRFESELSGAMDLRWEKGRLVLNSANANYSYHQLHAVMQQSLAQVMEQPIPQGPILNLGMGAGSTVCILREEMNLSQPITSVEIDQGIIAVAQSHFDIGRFEKHKVVCDDAFNYVASSKDSYALIIIDLFKDKEVDPRFLGEQFLTRCDELLRPGGAILFNYIGDMEHPAIDILHSTERKLLLIEENQILIYWKTVRS